MNDRTKLFLQHGACRAIIGRAFFLVGPRLLACEQNAVVDDGNVQLGVDLFEALEREASRVANVCAAHRPLGRRCTQQQRL